MRVQVSDWHGIMSRTADRPEGTWLLAIGDAAGIARAWHYSGVDAAARCERDAVAYLGREWAGGSRTVTVAQVFLSVDGRWHFEGEWEW